jgi:selenide, water dikinase
VANALSDIYAMGGKPLIALNVVCFPSRSMDIDILRQILKGGANKMLEAGVLLVGGHSVEDPEPKYGISVTGVVRPNKMITNGGAKAGDKLVLTKPLGIGIISTAVKAEKASKQIIAKAIETMSCLNARASALMQEIGVHACTDITGFGLLGHTQQLACNSGVGIEIKSKDVPLLPKVVDFVRQGFCPGGVQRNRDFYAPSVRFADKVPTEMQDILFDPQTSGGLLICVSARKASKLLNKLHEAGITEAAVIGSVLAEPTGKIVVE